MMKCVKEICETREKKVASPWIVYREEQMEDMRVNISNLVERKKKLQGARITRVRDRELARVKDEVRRAKKQQKMKLRSCERELWGRRIIEE